MISAARSKSGVLRACGWVDATTMVATARLNAAAPPRSV